jgi:transposase
LLNALGLRSLDKETLTLLRYGLAEIDGNEGAKILGITPNSFRVRASRTRHRKATLSPYKKKTGPKTRYKVEGYEVLIKSYRRKNLSESEISYILKETISAGISPATIGRFLKEEGFKRMHRRSLKRREKRLKR